MEGAGGGQVHGGVGSRAVPLPVADHTPQGDEKSEAGAPATMSDMTKIVVSRPPEEQKCVGQVLVMAGSGGVRWGRGLGRQPRPAMHLRVDDDSELNSATRRRWWPDEEGENEQ